MHNNSNGTLVIHSEQWAKPQELMNKAEEVTKAYNNVNDYWGVEEDYFIGPGWD